MIKPFIFLSLVVISLYACDKTELDLYDGPGKKPVYLPANELGDISSESPQPIVASGTIFLRDTLLFMLEQYKGIHVFSLKDSIQTVNLTFIKIPAITDFTLSGHYIYADSWKDIVVVDISNLYQAHESSRVRNVLSPSLFPPLYDGYFECVDESKGAVVGWEDAELTNAKCVTLN